MVPQIQTGRVFGYSFSALLGRPVPFIGSIMILYLPVIVGAALLFLMDGQRSPSALIALGSVTVFADLLLAPLGTAAVVQGVFLHLRGEEVTLTECWRGLGSIWWLVLLASLAVAILCGLGFMACIVPGFLILTELFVTGPSLVVERTTIADAFSRSCSLTEGNRLQIFFVVLGLWLLGLACDSTLQYVAGATTVGAVAQAMISLLVQALLTALHAVVAGVVYFELRRLREGLELEDMASVFD